MTTTTDNLAAALRQCLTRLEREGIQNVQMEEARAALAAYDAPVEVASARIVRYSGDARGVTVHAEGYGWKQDTHGLSFDAPLVDLRRYALEEQNRADQLERRARRMLAVVKHLSRGEPRIAPRYVVDGRETDDPDSPYAGDGECAPFVVFDIDAQENLPGEYATREEAQRVADERNLST